MFSITASDHGGHRTESSESAEAILAAFIPTFITAAVYIAIFAGVRNWHRKFYAPRTFLGTVPEKDRTPATQAGGSNWLWDFWNLPVTFVLQHNSLDAWLYLRFLGGIILISLYGVILTWPILLPVNATGGGDSTQLDRFSFSNIANNDSLWAHTIVAWVFFGGVMSLVAWERLRLIGIRQAYLLDEHKSGRISSRTVLFMNVPRDACQPERLKETFGEDAERSWPVQDISGLDELVQKRNDAAYALEGAQMDLIIKAMKLKKKKPSSRDVESGQPAVPKPQRPTQRSIPVIGAKMDPIEHYRAVVSDAAESIETQRRASESNLPETTGVFVAFTSQASAHRAFEGINFQPGPLKGTYLGPRPKELLWKNIALSASVRASKASLALAFVVAFTIFFSVPIGLIGSISNIQYLADNISWLSWLTELPGPILGVLTGLLPPFLTSWFVSYVPKLFRHIAKLSGEPTTAQAELKVQAWFFLFQVFQVFLVTTFSSGAAAVVFKIIQNPELAPDLLASSLPKASNFYLAYFILQGLGSAASNVLNYSDLFELLFYERLWDKTPRQHFETYAQMKGTPWGSWYPKFTNFLVIIIAYACIAPFILGFSFVGIFLYFLSYKYSLLYVRTTKIDTRGEAHKRALQQIPTGIYLAQLCLIGLFSARKASAQTTLMVISLIITAICNFLLDRTLRPLELYLGVDYWQDQEVPFLAEEDNIDPNDEQALHAASHSRRLGLMPLGKPAAHALSGFFDVFISNGRNYAQKILNEAASGRVDDDPEPLKSEDIDKAYLPPAMTSKTPKLWIPKDSLGVSKEEVEHNTAAGISTTDEAAEIDENGKLHWDHDFAHVPIYSKPKLY
ncbi:Hypothetical protein R9X50_00595100 [Acrodontium crateriforme]|uniref:DUF221-domain-containing protein n=1 Tax=Acrodontium crateriforme TaxID=150365 RepID=A0AAQ3MCZ4_9PEZI|nr:Hypothetical protein R9X50_00595100 [Acrodontium crateriforme]